jgi:hypothetical protein
MTEPGMYMSYAHSMSDENQTTEQQASELEREERRLERLRLVVTAWPPQEHFEDDPPPQTAA